MASCTFTERDKNLESLEETKNGMFICVCARVSGTQVTKIKLRDFTKTLIPLVFWKRSDYLASIVCHAHMEASLTIAFSLYYLRIIGPLKPRS